MNRAIFALLSVWLGLAAGCKSSDDSRDDGSGIGGDGSGDGSAGDGSGSDDGSGDTGGGSGDDGTGDDGGGPKFDVGDTSTDDGTGPEDSDNDGIPDDDDPFPDDQDQPGTAASNTVYAHSSSALYTMHVETYDINEVGSFQWPADGGGHQMTDIAIDRYGVLYGLTFDRAYICNPLSAECFLFATLPEEFNGMTLVPAGTIDPEKDAIIGISNTGGWYHLQLSGGALNPVLVGMYGGTYQSSGDAFSIEEVGTYASTTLVDWMTDEDKIVVVDPTTGAVTSEITTVTGYTRIWGLAGWHEKIFAFDETGDVLLVDPSDGAVTLLDATGIMWWGAGVRTAIGPPG